MLIDVGDGGGTCSHSDEKAYHRQVLEAVASEKAPDTKIHAIGVLDVNRLREEFLKHLAGLNGGTYKYIEH